MAPCSCIFSQCPRSRFVSSSLHHLLLPFMAWASAVLFLLLLSVPAGANADDLPSGAASSLCAAKCGTCPIVCTSAPPPPQSYTIRQLPAPPPPPQVKNIGQSPPASPTPPPPTGGQRGTYPYYYFYTSSAPSPGAATGCLPRLLLFSALLALCC